jgi:hypothetical protein
MKMMLPITLMLLSLCVKGHAQDVGTAIGMNASPVLQENRQDDKPQTQQEQQLANKRLQVAKQLVQIKQWYNSMMAGIQHMQLITTCMLVLVV